MMSGSDLSNLPMNFAPFALVGTTSRREECLRRLQVTPDYQGEMPPADLDRYRMVIDLQLEDHPSRLDRYGRSEELLIVGAAVKKSLLGMCLMHRHLRQDKLLGMNALPGFLDRELWEISYLEKSSREIIGELSAFWNQPCEPIQDRVGMVSPRVLFLIINEAFLVEQEGTATREDIDTAMKLGTNYPFGPFEWAEKIGHRDIVETLEALHADSGDARFVPVPSLQKAMTNR